MHAVAPITSTYKEFPIPGYNWPVIDPLGALDRILICMCSVLYVLYVILYCQCPKGRITDAITTPYKYVSSLFLTSLASNLACPRPLSLSGGRVSKSPSTSHFLRAALPISTSRSLQWPLFYSYYQEVVREKGSTQGSLGERWSR